MKHILKSCKCLHCISCHYNCELSPDSSIKSQYCVNHQFSVWPESNQYFKIGIGQLLKKTRYNFMDAGFVFIDFSTPNVHFFTNGRWLEYLMKAGLHYILIADRALQPLAAYWKKNHSQIAAVINTTDSNDEIEKKTNSAFMGRWDLNTPRNKLNELEVRVLDLAIIGRSVNDISCQLNLSNQRIYATKRSINKKMGGHINTLIIG